MKDQDLKLVGLFTFTLFKYGQEHRLCRSAQATVGALVEKLELIKNLKCLGEGEKKISNGGQSFFVLSFSFSLSL